MGNAGREGRKGRLWKDFNAWNFAEILYPGACYYANMGLATRSYPNHIRVPASRDHCTLSTTPRS